MFKQSLDYENEELLRMCQDFFGGVYWAWYEASLAAAGEQRTLEILRILSDRFAELEVKALKALWGREFENLEQITQAIDVIHRVVAYEGPRRGSTPIWSMNGNDSGHEAIHHCPIHSATPEHLKGRGPTALCSVYCNSIGQKLYGKLGYTIRQDHWLAKGDSHCGFQIDRAKAC